MGGGVLEQLDLIEGAGNDSSLADYDSADWDFGCFIGFGRLAQRLAHEIVVALQINDGIVHEVRVPALRGLTLPASIRNGRRDDSGNERRRNRPGIARTRARFDRSQSAAVLKPRALRAERIGNDPRGAWEEGRAAEVLLQTGTAANGSALDNHARSRFRSDAN